MNNLFLENKYSKWYFSIIEKSQSNNGSYLEKHHIIPKSLGGTNLSSNIAKLTTKQHFVCHLLLIKMTEGTNKSKMKMAAWAMSTLHSRNHQNQRYKVNSRIFEILRETALRDENRIQHLKESNRKEKNPFYGKKHTAESKLKMSQNKKGKKIGKENPFFGKNHTDEVRARISIARKTQVVSEETKAARSKGLIEYYQSPDARQKLSEIMKKVCNDPAYRAKRGWKPLKVDN
jgi:hypothetical protein